VESLPRFSAQTNQLLLLAEKHLSPHACRTENSFGRRFALSHDPFRLEFARDETRILHSSAFRRLKHKTQVFLSPNNDHICTRMEHVLHVSSIATVIGRCLGLNTDLINAIAKGHDLGHPPFGHAGEKTIDNLVCQSGSAKGFKHEMHGLRVVDTLTGPEKGLNLTYEVRDGIVTHCGESFEQAVKPDRSRRGTPLERVIDRTELPCTLEGALVRVVDRIAYLGRDLEDGMKAGLVHRSDIPTEVTSVLGFNNGQIIGTFVADVIEQSYQQDTIALSDTVFSAMQVLKEFNYRRIYRHEVVVDLSEKTDMMLRMLWDKHQVVFEKSARGTDIDYQHTVQKKAPVLAVFFQFIRDMHYSETTADWQILADYISGMTDIFAKRCYEELFIPLPMV